MNQLLSRIAPILVTASKALLRALAEQTIWLANTIRKAISAVGRLVTKFARLLWALYYRLESQILLVVVDIGLALLALRYFALLLAIAIGLLYFGFWKLAVLYSLFIAWAVFRFFRVDPEAAALQRAQHQKNRELSVRIVRWPFRAMASVALLYLALKIVDLGIFNALWKKDTHTESVFSKVEDGLNGPRQDSSSQVETQRNRSEMRAAPKQKSASTHDSAAPMQTTDPESAKTAQEESPTLAEMTRSRNTSNEQTRRQAPGTSTSAERSEYSNASPMFVEEPAPGIRPLEPAFVRVPHLSGGPGDYIECGPDCLTAKVGGNRVILYDVSLVNNTAPNQTVAIRLRTRSICFCSGPSEQLTVSPPYGKPFHIVHRLIQTDNPSAEIVGAFAINLESNAPRGQYKFKMELLLGNILFARRTLVVDVN
jgi:hypothetical protein